MEPRMTPTPHVPHPRARSESPAPTRQEGPPTPLEYAPRLVVAPSPRELGEQAAAAAAETLEAAIRNNGSARLMLAAAESQRPTLDALRRRSRIDWSLVQCFHMDEYLGLPSHAPQKFGNWLSRTFIDCLPHRPVFHRIDDSGDATADRMRYTSLMGSEPFDLVLLGLGVSGHLAFNDPPANLTDNTYMRAVHLSDVSRKQQVDDGQFDDIQAVPDCALTVTIPRLLLSSAIIASVPGRSKRLAVRQSMTMPITGDHPGTALRLHPNVMLCLDRESSPEQSPTP